MELYSELIKSNIEIKFNSEDIKKSIENFINDNFSATFTIEDIEDLESHPNYKKIVEVKDKIFF